MVDAGLAAHRGVDLRQQRGGYLDEVDAPLVAGRRKAGHVADHAAADGNQAAVPIEPVLQQGVEDPVEDVQILVFLAVGQNHLRDLVAG